MVAGFLPSIAKTWGCHSSRLRLDNLNMKKSFLPNYRTVLLLERLFHIFAALLILIIYCSHEFLEIKPEHLLLALVFVTVVQVLSGVIRILTFKDASARTGLKWWLRLWLGTILVWGLVILLGEALTRPSVLFFGDGRVPGPHWFELLAILLTPFWLLFLCSRYIFLLFDEPDSPCRKIGSEGQNAKLPDQSYSRYLDLPGTKSSKH